MKNPVYRFLLFTVAIALLQWFLPFWVLPAGTVFMAFVWGKTARETRNIGGWGAAASWLVLALVLDSQNYHILSRQVAAIFYMPSYALLYPLMLFIAWLTGTFAALTGYHLQRLLLSEDDRWRRDE
ncbi:MAG: hypothetical protein V4543_02960 [Bacteroidota bacterium]